MKLHVSIGGLNNVLLSKAVMISLWLFSSKLLWDLVYAWINVSTH